MVGVRVGVRARVRVRVRVRVGFRIRVRVRVRLGVRVRLRVRLRVRARRLEDVGQLVEAVEHVLQQLHHDPRLDGGRGSRVVEDR